MTFMFKERSSYRPIETAYYSQSIRKKAYITKELRFLKNKIKFFLEHTFIYFQKDKNILTAWASEKINFVIEHVNIYKR